MGEIKEEKGVMEGEGEGCRNTSVTFRSWWPVGDDREETWPRPQKRIFCFALPDHVTIINSYFNCAAVLIRFQPVNRGRTGKRLAQECADLSAG